MTQQSLARVIPPLKSHVSKNLTSIYLGLILLAMAVLVTACSGDIANLTGQAQTRNAEDTVAMSAVQQIQVCNHSGNILVRSDAASDKVTVKSTRKVYIDSNAPKTEVDQRFQTLTVDTHGGSSSACSWLNQTTNENTLVVIAATKDDQNHNKLRPDRIDLEILIPTSLVKQQSVAIQLEGEDQTEVQGLGGNLQLTSLTGDVNVTQSFLDQRSRLYSPSGDVNFSGELHGQSTTYDLISDSGNVTLTLPAQTNAVLHAEAPDGTITNDFAPGQKSSSELNPDAGNANVTLNIHSGDGDIFIHKG